MAILRMRELIQHLGARGAEANARRAVERVAREDQRLVAALARLSAPAEESAATLADAV